MHKTLVQDYVHQTHALDDMQVQGLCASARTIYYIYYMYYQDSILSPYKALRTGRSLIRNSTSFMAASIDFM